jgi:uncharacterized protein
VIRAVAKALFPLALTCAALVPCGALAAVPPVPTRWVTDDAGFLSEGTRRSLDARLEAYERQTGHQVLVWIGRTTGGEPVEDFSVAAFKAWRPGRKGIDDGLVLFILSEDRKIRIEVGYGLEGQVPDAIASRIIRETIAPRLQADDRDGAVTSGVDAMLAAIEGQAPAAAPTTEERSPERPYVGGQRSLTAGEKVIIGLLVVGFLILLVTNPSLAIWLLFNIFAGGSGGGGGGGGGGYSGGGGRSGGGGATGSW